MSTDGRSDEPKTIVPFDLHRGTNRRHRQRAITVEKKVVKFNLNQKQSSSGHGTKKWTDGLTDG